jgi:cell division protein FtsI/penicillin-binding protein 2
VHSGTLRARQLAVFFFFILSLSVLTARLFYIQVLRHSFYKKLADEQHTVSLEIAPKRGTIFDRNMRVLAINLHSDSVFANPRIIKDKAGAAAALSRILGMNESFIYDRLSKEKAFVWIKRKVSPEVSARVKGLKIEGVDIVQESERSYPDKALACHAIGTVDIDNNGLEGLELKYNKYLKGEAGWVVSTQDAKRKLLESYRYEYIPPKNGLNLVLTIDEVIQSIAERELAKSFQKFNAKGASIIVIDPRNGDVLALANMPNYDLNEPGARSNEAIRNRAINDFFEPGSVFKIITASAILEERAVKLTDKFDCESGEWHIGRRTLHDHTPHGIITFKEIIEVSSNIGTVKAALRLGQEKMYKYMQSFGLYERAGIDLPGEVSGMNRPLKGWSKVSMYAIPMGQEVTVTALQLVCAIAVIADNGYIVTPRVVKQITDGQGRVIKDFPPKVRRRVISTDTVLKMRGVLKGVVDSGTGKKAKLEDYNAGGKTGTAQKVESGTYSHSKFVGSFIGFAPIEKPVLAVVVCVDEPHPVYYGGDVAAPVFRNVVNDSLRYLNSKVN